MKNSKVNRAKTPQEVYNPQARSLTTFQGGTWKYFQRNTNNLQREDKRGIADFHPGEGESLHGLVKGLLGYQEFGNLGCRGRLF